ncbi:MAG: NAD(P)H-dependent oxidoreductase [Anaerolineae bacterium]|nr:NAD(P)H-dependent oxidoreductase [Anaerolineae bacterium]
MFILGIVGSPRKKGRTHALVEAALQGAAAAGAETRELFLIDYPIAQFASSGGSEEGVRFCPRELSDLCGQADALVIGAPVYWGDINGLTKDFVDSVHIAGSNGKPGLGIAIAGGSGKGLLSGVQSIYHFFYHKQMRGVEPWPVSRFNLEEALQGLHDSGARLVELAEHQEPFPGQTRDDVWAPCVAHYATVPYLRDGPVEEFMMLARQLLKTRGGGRADEARMDQARREFMQALEARERGDLGVAGRHAVNCYHLLFYN